MIDRSLISTCLGIILITIGFDINMFANENGNTRTAFKSLMNLGWVLLVSGFSLTLYSRVHLLLFNQRVLQLLLVIIIANGCLVHIPGIVTAYLPFTARSLRASIIISKLEVIFYVQEISLSSLYTFLFIKFIRRSPTPCEHETIDATAKMTFVGLIAGQIVVLVSDVCMVVLLFQNFYLARKLIIPLNYAIKVLIEFFVLNQLVRFSSTGALNTGLDVVSGDMSQMMAQGTVDVEVQRAGSFQFASLHLESRVKNCQT